MSVFYCMESYVDSHTLHTCALAHTTDIAQVCVGFQKIVCVLTRGVACIPYTRARWHALQTWRNCAWKVECFPVCCSVLQCVAVSCSVLQCVAVCCSVLQCVAVSRTAMCGKLSVFYRMESYVFSHTLHTCALAHTTDIAQVCVGCEKVVA